ncbi:TonB-dependent receptor [Niveispirillum irakense]|uniref:TonB-dependent receptor n=1 Tax=Niveispirillum irakense TaxID=34011 RepID=UPI000406FDE6|nr:TonB-dependent receptor [Niveispirillum irakense]
MTNRSIRTATLLSSAAAAVLTLAAPALAEPATLDEIIVTAQKRSQNLQEVPVSVAAISADQLANFGAGGGDIRFLSARVPSLNAESSFGRTFPRFYIRGLGNTDFDLNASQPVSLVYDEVVLENPIMKGFPVFDVEQIEVLRGPQGTLFGRNTPAGIISVTSRKPTFETEGYGQVSYGRWNAIEAEGAIGGALIDNKLAARISFLHQRRDGYVDNDFTGEKNAMEGYEDTAARLQLLYTPTERFTANLNGHFRSLDGTARVFRANIIEKGSNDLVDGFSPYHAFTDGQNDQEVNSRGANLNAQYEFDNFTLTSITAYEYVDAFSRGDVDGGVAGRGPGTVPFSVESASKINGIDQFTQELRLASSDEGPLKWQTGLYYFDEKADFANLSYGAASTDSLKRTTVANSVQDNDTWAVFGQLSYELTEQLTLTGGLRYTEDNKTLVRREVTYTSGTPVNGSVSRAKTSDERVSWDLAADYAFTEEVRGFVRVASGFRAPTIQPRSVNITTADSEKVMSYEAGVKSDLFGKRARINLTGFYYEVKDQQFTAVGGVSNNNTLLNADKGIGKGFEADLEFLPVENLLLTVGTSYNRTEIKDANLFVPACSGGCSVTDPIRVVGTSRQASINGNPFPQAPRWIFNTTARYGIPVGENDEVYAFTDWSFKSTANFFLYESAEFRSDARWQGGLRVGYSYDGGRFDVSAFVRNITNEQGLEGAIDFNNLTGFVIEPRTYGVTARMTF